MTSKERVKRAVEFRTPDRLPLEFGAFGASDTAGLGWNQIGTGDNSKRETVDEWGCTWQRNETKNMGQVKGHPLESWDNLSGYRFPDPDNPVFWEGIEERAKALDRDLYIKTGIFMVFFERLHSLRGFENLMMDFYLER